MIVTHSYNIWICQIHNYYGFDIHRTTAVNSSINSQYLTIFHQESQILDGRLKRTIRLIKKQCIIMRN